jgi:uridylate kinase
VTDNTVLILRLAEYAAEIKQIHDKGIEIAIVIGGGNILEE